MAAPEVSIVVPTYCEGQNLGVLIPAIADAFSGSDRTWEVIVVDDDSPDQTREVCATLQKQYPVRLIVRTGERGLSSAVIAGMRAADGRVLVCMDADLSHPPDSILEVVDALETKSGDSLVHDFAIGSRYVAGGTTEEGWGVFRWLNSQIATWLARPLTKARDPMAGFFALRRADFEAASERLDPVGYKIGLELMVKCDCRRVAEVPIQFRNRLHGESKLSLREQINYLKHLSRLYRHRLPRWVEFTSFCLVGLSGVFVDLSLVALLLALSLRMPAASALAIWGAMSWNFVWNRRVTFAECRRDSMLRQYVAFCASCLVGGAVNWTTRVLLWRFVPYFSEHELLAAGAGVATGLFFNYGLCRTLVFRRGQPRPAMSHSPMPRRDAQLQALSRALLAFAAITIPAVVNAETPATETTMPTIASEMVNDDVVEQRLKAAAEFLSSDELEGRGVRTRGLDRAADYIADEFRTAGLNVSHYGGTPFHEFRLFSMATKGSVQELTLGRKELKLRDDFSSLTVSINGGFSQSIAFVGYGITAPKLGYDDYAGIDVTGKAVIVLRHEPQQSDPESVFDGLENSAFAYIRPKIDNALQHGATMIIIVTDQHTIDATPAADGATAESTDPLLDVEIEDGSLRGTIPVVHCRRALIEELIRTTTGKDLADLESQIDETFQPQSLVLDDVRVAGRVGLSKEGRTLRNVVATLDATGPTAEETIVIGAHYDHLGRGGWGSLAIGANDEIHNGADDNASGTSVLLEVARQLATVDQPLSRRILFIAFSAEEMGLIGSKRYVQDPLVPLSDTVAMLNLDMVGRLRDDRLTVYGTGTAAEWPVLLDHAAAAQQFKITRRPGGYGPSDHASFFEHGIPVLHFFTGFHPQYHRPDDDAELLNYEGMRRITSMVRDLALTLATADERPTRSGSPGAFDLTQLDDGDPETEDGRPVLGVVLEPTGEKGVLVKRLIRQTTAERHGIRPGDVLLAIDGKQLDTPADVIEALRAQQVGQKILIRLSRRGVEMELDVTL